MQCTCPVTRDCVFIPEKSENHIGGEHFKPSENDEQDPNQAFFYKHVFKSSEELCDVVIYALRTGIGLRSPQKSGNCYVYYLHFPFDVGYFPYRLQGPPSTAIVKVVCRFIVCQYCFLHCPSYVVTIYPWMPKEDRN